MKRSISTLVLLFIVSVAVGKSNKDLVKADYLYNHLAYYEAINYYQKIALSLNDPVILGKLGDCYRLTKEPAEANQWYAKAIILNGCPLEIKLHYAQTLMNTGDYAKALPYLKDYHESKPEDRRVVNLIASCENMNKMKAQIPVGSIQFQSFNTDKSYFGPALRRNQLFFTVDSVEHKAARKDNWTGEPFYKIYSVNCMPDGKCNVPRELLGKTNTKYHDGPCAFNADGSVMYFTRTNYENKLFTERPEPDKNDIVRLEIMIATDFDEAMGKYKKIASFKYNNRNYSTAHPAISKDGNMLVFASDMPGGQGGTDLYVCRKLLDGSWSVPENAGLDINTEGDELFPFLDNNNVLYFSSDGQMGYGGLDIYKATWDTTKNVFTTPVNMGMPLNSSYDDMSLVMYDDGSMGYFASDRPAERKEDNIYSFSPQSLYLSVTGIDSLTGMVIPNFNLVLSNPNRVDTLAANTNGKVFTQLYPHMPYDAKAMAFNYQPKQITINNDGPVKRMDTIYATVKLMPDVSINYQVVVYDVVARTPIEDPEIVFHKAGRMHADTMQLATGASYNTTLDADNTYQIFAIKNNYFGNEKQISTKGITPKAGGVKIVDTLFMRKLQIGDVYKIDNVYYDYNKANIREDAKPALEGLISILKQYPNMKIQINSHTDCRGADKYNLKLSDARAHAVVNYLQERGISIERLRYKGYGETVPVYKCPVCERCTEAEHQANRRTEFTIIAM